MTDSIIKNQILPNKISNESLRGGIKHLESMLSEDYPKSNSIISDVGFLRNSKEEAERILQSAHNLGKLSVLVPIGLWGFSKGLTAPDLDIRYLGIGRHRYFLFHSALGLVILRHLYFKWLNKTDDQDQWINRVKKKTVGTLLGAFAMGVGVHLAIDVFQPKAVIFPFFGSLVNGTMVDDNIWLMGNSLWAFYIGHNMFSLVLADELKQAKKYVKSHFSKSVKISD